MTDTLHQFNHRIARKAAALKAPAHVMLCWLMVVALLGFTTNLCCCLVAMPAAASSNAIAQTASQTASTSSAMLMAAGGHGCCVKNSSTDEEAQSPNGTTPSPNSTPHPTSSCQCQGDALDAPSHSTTVHYSSASTDLGVFTLLRLTASWQLPAPADFGFAHKKASPPDTRGVTLVALACQLTV